LGNILSFVGFVLNNWSFFLTLQDYNDYKGDDEGHPPSEADLEVRLTTA